MKEPATYSATHSADLAKPKPEVVGSTNPAEVKERMRENLVLVGKNRDEEAFADLYSYFAGRVKSFLIGRGMNEDSAEELMQDIMLIIWRRAESYDRTKAAASTWIFTIARNRHIDFIRGNKRIEVELDDEILELETTERDIQEKHVDSEHASRRLAIALETLPKEQKQVMHLSYFRGQSHGAIAAWLDLPVGTVKSRIRLATNAMKKHLAGDDYIH